MSLRSHLRYGAVNRNSGFLACRTFFTSGFSGCLAKASNAGKGCNHISFGGIVAAGPIYGMPFHHVAPLDGVFLKLTTPALIDDIPGSGMFQS